MRQRATVFIRRHHLTPYVLLLPSAVAIGLLLFWPTADTGQYLIIPTMLKKLMTGAPFDSTVAAANTQLQNVLNTGSQG